METRTRGWNSLLDKKKDLRINQTEAEKKLWIELKKHKEDRFRRQHGIGPYIADFYHASSMTVIEIDGEIHDDPEVQKNDKMREEYLQERGYKIIRFTNEEVLNELESVTKKIKSNLQTIPNPILKFSFQGGRGRRTEEVTAPTQGGRGRRTEEVTLPTKEIKSLLNKTWKIKTPYENTPVIDRICTYRKIDPLQELTELHSPWFLKDIDKAVVRVTNAIKNQERIMIFGDYDVDGVTGATILYLGLKQLGANVSVRLPHREKDGYGLNTRVLDECLEAKVKVVITVDCGISNVKEVEYGKALGLDIIITDHHSIPPVIPDAYAVINPKQSDCSYPEKEIVGSVVAFKLICALFEVHTIENWKLKIENLMDLAALATVADCAPLRGENRLIVKQGLLQFANTQHRGLRTLLESYELTSKPITSYHLGFNIAPCINAAGRLEDPMIAFKMMIGDTEKALELRQMNLDRQEIVRIALEEAMEQVEKHYKDDPILIFWAENWQPGIIGLLAGRLCERYYRPVICLTRHEEKYVGSCRSIPEINIVEVLQKHEDLFLNYGGHAQAAGLSISPEKLDELRRRLIEDIRDQVKKNPVHPHLNLDTEIMTDEIHLENVEKMKSLEPFGMGNPTPKFLFRNVELKQIRAVGQDKTHLQFGFQQGNQTFKGIAFQFSEYHDTIKQWTTVDLACQLQKNEFRGEVSVDLQVVDMRKACSD